MTRKNLVGLTSKSKLIDAAFKEKDLDAYFSIGIVLQEARNIFVKEISKSGEIYVEICDNMNSSLVVKRLVKNMVENHQVRKLKITKD